MASIDGQDLVDVSSIGSALALFTMPASQWRTCTGYPGIDWNTQAIGLKEQKFGANEQVSGPDQNDLMVARAGIGPPSMSQGADRASITNKSMPMLTELTAAATP